MSYLLGMRIALPLRPGFAAGIPRSGFALIGLITVAIGQDYLFSRIYRTGFYWSESALYQTLWLFFPALLILQRWGIRSCRLPRWAAVCSALPCAVLHLLLFSGWFTAVSALVFTPGHRFLALLGSASAGQLVILIGVYAIAGYRSPNGAAVPTPGLRFRSGSTTVRVNPADIVCLESDKPYTAIHTRTERYLDDRSLTQLAELLPADDFLRVHRSCIVRGTAVRQLRARGNGDYDAELENGQRVRLSRHRRDVWVHLLHS